MILPGHRMKTALLLCIIMVSALFQVASAENLLIIRSRNPLYKDISDNVEASLRSQYTIEVMTRFRTAADISAKISEFKPIIVILVDSRPVSLYQEYVQSQPSTTPVPAAIAIQDVFPSTSSVGIRNATGIFYQVPIVVGIQKLGAKVDRPLKKVGVVYREYFKSYMQANIVSCWDQNIQLITKSLPNTDPMMKQKVEAALEEFRKNKVEALWVPNDDELVRSDILHDVWIPFVYKYKMPVVVSNQFLMSPDSGLGDICVLPDRKALSAQVVAKVNEIARAGYAVSDMVEPVKVYSSIYSTTSGAAAAVQTPVQPAVTRKSPDVAAKPVEPASTPVVSEKAVTAKVPDEPPVSQPVVASVAETSPEPVQVEERPRVSETKNTPVAVDSRKAVPPKEKAVTKVSVASKVQEIPVSRRPDQKTLQVEAAQQISELQNVDTIQGVFTPLEAYVDVTTDPSVVVSALQRNAPMLGFARKGDRFHVIGHNNLWYKIQFFNTLGWIEKKNVQLVTQTDVVATTARPASGAQFGNLWTIVSLIIAAVLAIVVVALVIMRRASGSRHLPPVKIPNSRSCLVIVPRKRSRSSEVDNGDLLREILTKIGFEITAVNNIPEVKNILLHYLPDIICVDWRFDTNVNSTIQNMLSERSSMAHMLVIFYNTVDAFSIKKNQAFINTHYLGTSFTAKDIYKIITPLINTEMHSESSSVPRKNLEGEIDKDSLPEIFQFIELGKKNGCLMIELEKPYGMIFFEGGQIIYATTVNVNGIDAIYEVLNLRKGTFRFIVDKMPKTKNLQISTFEVLMEWAKVNDETGANVEGSL